MSLVSVTLYGGPKDGDVFVWEDTDCHTRIFIPVVLPIQHRFTRESGYTKVDSGPRQAIYKLFRCGFLDDFKIYANYEFEGYVR